MIFNIQFDFRKIEQNKFGILLAFGNIQFHIISQDVYDNWKYKEFVTNQIQEQAWQLFRSIQPYIYGQNGHDFIHAAWA